MGDAKAHDSQALKSQNLRAGEGFFEARSNRIRYICLHSDQIGRGGRC